MSSEIKCCHRPQSSERYLHFKQNPTLETDWPPVSHRTGPLSTLRRNCVKAHPTEECRKKTRNPPPLQVSQFAELPSRTANRTRTGGGGLVSLGVHGTHKQTHPWTPWGALLKCQPGGPGPASQYRCPTAAVVVQCLVNIQINQLPNLSCPYLRTLSPGCLWTGLIS